MRPDAPSTRSLQTRDGRPDGDPRLGRTLVAALAAALALTLGLGVLTAPRTGAAGGGEAAVAVAEDPVCVIETTRTTDPVIGLCGASPGGGGGGALYQLDQECPNLGSGTFRLRLTANVKRRDAAPASGAFAVILWDGAPDSGSSNVLTASTFLVSDPPVNPQYAQVVHEFPSVQLVGDQLAVTLETGEENLCVPAWTGGPYPTYALTSGQWFLLGQGDLAQKIEIFEIGGGDPTPAVTPTETFPTTATPQPTATPPVGGGGDDEPTPCTGYTVILTGSIQGQQGAEFGSETVVYSTQDLLGPVELTFTPRDSGETVTVQLEDDLLSGNLEPWDEQFLGGLGLPVDTLGTLTFRLPDCEDAQQQSARSASVSAPLGLFFQSIVFARQADGSQYGQILTSATNGELIRAGDTAHFPTTHDSGRFRVNAHVSAAVDGTTVVWTPVDPVGRALAPGHAVTLNRGGSTQINDVGSFFALGDRKGYLLEMAVVAGAAHGLAFVLDGNGGFPGTSDPTTVTPARPAQRVTLLEVGSVAGLNEFSGSAFITNHSPSTAQVRADLYARGAVGVTDTASFPLPAGDSLALGDVIVGMFGLQDTVGTLVLTATNQTMISAVGREFAVYRDGQGVVAGTAGQLMPGLTDDDRLVSGAAYDFIALRQRQTQDGPERSHLAIFNPGPSSATITGRTFSADGAFEGTVQRTVRAGELVRVNNVLEEANPAQDGGLKRLELTVSGPVHALAYRVNPTGDPVTLRPIRR